MKHDLLEWRTNAHANPFTWNMKKMIIFALAFTILNSCTSKQSRKRPTDKVTPTHLISDESRASYDGAIDSGGGLAVVCRNEDKTIGTVRLFDLFEGEKLYSLKFTQSDEDPIDQLVKMLGKTSFFQPIDNSLNQTIKENAKKIITFLDSETRLKKIDDAATIILPSTCTLEQLAVYVSDNQLLVDQLYYEKMSKTDQAALFAHEMIYRIHRSFGAKDSLYTRKYVAYLFASDLKITDPMEGLPDEKERIMCTGSVGGILKDSTEFTRGFLFPLDEEHNRYRMQFDFLGGNLLISKKYFDFDLSDFQVHLANISGSREHIAQYSRSHQVETVSQIDGEDLLYLNLEPLPVKGNLYNNTFTLSGNQGWMESRKLSKIKIQCSNTEGLLPDSPQKWISISSAYQKTDQIFNKKWQEALINLTQITHDNDDNTCAPFSDLIADLKNDQVSGSVAKAINDLSFWASRSNDYDIALIQDLSHRFLDLVSTTKESLLTQNITLPQNTQHYIGIQFDSQFSKKQATVTIEPFQLGYKINFQGLEYTSAKLRLTIESIDLELGNQRLVFVYRLGENQNLNLYTIPFSNPFSFDEEDKTSQVSPSQLKAALCPKE